ncbi:MAG: ATP-binding cassette domain-containing protein, partial [Ruminococcaceae bacterium]|nr:ATP-binding cassette domain-containing protein [Oscillospiraceae bacterium]
SIGFVFQSYNLIPHQSILANVELSLTIAGMSRKQRRDKAKRALEEVGLLDQRHKKPNQMSGGQMQRVAIARALVNDPDILLADEPTGALDSETSVQVLDLLKKVAANRLVIMVTHNEQLAGSYATRTIKLLDGKIISDSDPYEVAEKDSAASKPSRLAKVSMSFLSSISLSFNNLRTKKGRTILTSFASSIGIIGIALILALSAGVNNYIFDLQKETMASYPITISAETRDLSAAFGAGGGMMGRRNETVDESSDERTTVIADYSDIESDESYLASVKKNNLSLFKDYLDEPSSEIHQYIGENGVVYTYDVNFDVYSYDSEGKLVNSDSDAGGRSRPISGFTSQEHFNVVFGADTGSGATNFSELMKGTHGAIISEVITDSYELLYGSWPENYDEIILVLGSETSLPPTTLYQLGLITADELDSLKDQLKKGEELPEKTWTYGELADRSFYLVPSSDRYVENSYGTFSHVEESALGFEKYVDEGIKLKVTGIVKALPEAANAAISTAAAYTTELTDYLIDYVNDSPVVLAQKATPEINVLNGLVFEAADEEEMIAVASQYVSQLSVSEKASLYSMILSTKAENTEGKATENTDSQSDNEAGMEAGSGPMQMPQQ